MNSIIPTTSYLVCATPRSGSTLLCETLRATGVAGVPLEHFEILLHSGLPRQPREYFDGVADAGVLQLLAPLQAGRPSGEPAEAWRSRVVRQGLTANGVWGGKLMWGHVADLLSRAGRLDGLADARLETALRALLGDVRLVFVTRSDKVAQAVSLWRAVQTQRWRADADAPRRPHDAEYRFTAIDHLVSQLQADEAAWRAWFATHAPAEPLELSYEAIAADPRAAVGRVLDFCGLPRVAIPDPPLRHQRDARSREWGERYASERRVHEAVA
ncbi:MAG TPA: Stf0 family sulfotransferase [Conexibacter sp.]|nr:Stf0 family sulfotransferase [Conexibacter sp.]